MRKLSLRIRELNDGRFQVRYYWRFWEKTHIEYFDTEKELLEFLTKIITNTDWRKQ